ncbi:DNA polymerase III subunit epsilon [Gammaproteobacteria bacterium]
MVSNLILSGIGMRAEIYSDGACRGNPGPGGWAAIVRISNQEKILSGAEINTTNNRMELMGAIQGLESLAEPYHVSLYTDSQYVKKGMETWIAAWKKKGWITQEKSPVKNMDLWMRLDQVCSYHVIEWHWVRGHTGNAGNELADQSANQAIDKMLRSQPKSTEAKIVSTPKLRQIVLDTETTGFKPEEGHRIIEIGCVELIDRKRTDRQWQTYLYPDRAIDPGAIGVHGITLQKLEGKPRFKEIADDLIEFLRGAEVLIHNAPFDVGFLNHELKNIGKEPIEKICKIIDTLTLARARHPGQKNTLDALCQRYQIDNSKRDLHGALLDAELLVKVYLAMTGGQVKMSLENKQSEEKIVVQVLSKNRPRLQIVLPFPEEESEHQIRLAAIEKMSGGNCLWQKLED